MNRLSTHFANTETLRLSSLTTGYINHGKDVKVTSCLDEILMSGELTCLLGPNGAGKSTLLKTLSAFIPPLKGQIFVLGKQLTQYSRSELAKIIGVVLTDRLQLDNMTVFDLIAMGRTPYTNYFGQLQKTDIIKIEEAIHLINISDLSNRFVSTLSDGERQKVMIAKAIAQETPVIFLDEPTAFLDFPSKVEIMTLLKRLASETGKTIFLSTHDIEISLQIADRLWLMDKNLGVTTGDPETLSTDGSITRYFSSPILSFDATTRRFNIK